MRATLLLLTGASGAGKTTVVEEIARRRRPGLRAYHFDSIGVPSTEVMIERHGSGERWQEAMTMIWIERLSQNPDQATGMVLEGQIRPHIIRSAWPAQSSVICLIALIDCAPEVRRGRLAGPRGQPELATSGMDSWAAYLRGQADALNLPILDTTSATVGQIADAIEALLRA